VAEGQADGVDGGDVERGLTGDTADAVGSEELLHACVVLRIGVEFYYQAQTGSAVLSVWVTCGETRLFCLAKAKLKAIRERTPGAKARIISAHEEAQG
jgi:hypothetical protein